MTHSRIAGILLAAGQGSRPGQPKALVEIDGQPLATRAIGPTTWTPAPTWTGSLA